jgi:8-oxo-dGTP diphosphatase
LIDVDERLLLTDRSQAKTMREFWEFPGGKLAKGETAKDALRRELGEELGIRISTCEHFHRLEHDYPDLHVAIDFFLVREWQGTPSGMEGQELRWLVREWQGTPSGMEGQELRWLVPADISPGLLLPADAPVLELLKKM